MTIGKSTHGRKATMMPTAIIPALEAARERPDLFADWLAFPEHVDIATFPEWMQVQIEAADA